MWTDSLWPGARVTAVQCSTWEPTAPVIAQLTVAEPVPAALELETPIVNPIWDPAETVASSAVLVIDSAGHWTVTEAVELSLPALPVLTDAVLLTEAQSA